MRDAAEQQARESATAAPSDDNGISSFVSDCVDACLMIADWLLDEERKPGTFEGFNLGTKSWETVDDLAKTMIEILDLGDVEFVHTGGERGWTGDVVKMLLDTSKIDAMGWTARVSFKDGITRYLETLKDA